MRAKDSRSVLISVFSTVVLLLSAIAGVRAKDANGVVLHGSVVSVSEGPIEGVLVSARKAGSHITVTVVSDRNGQYAFPSEKLTSGQYSLSIRAAGYQLISPKALDLPSPTAVDLKIDQTGDVSSQLSSAEWLNSFPGTHEQKSFLLNCVLCHTLERIAKSHHDPEEWLSVFDRMATYNAVDSTSRPQKGVGGSSARFGSPERLRQQAEYMSTINLSHGAKWPYRLTTFPRPKGSATRVVITEYDLPRGDTLPHDLAVDPHGNVWYADAGYNYIGELEPGTGKINEYSVPILRADYPLGLLDIEFDKDGYLWIAPWLQANKFIRFSASTLKFATWDIPQGENDKGIPPLAFLMPSQDNVDGKVWGTDARGKIFRLDVHSGKVETFSVFDVLQETASAEGHSMSSDQQGHSVYQVTADSENNCYFMDTFGSIGRIDAKTLKIDFYPTPTSNSYPRRGHMDAHNGLWFGEYRADRIGYLDTNDKHFHEWLAPNPWTATYEVAPDASGQVWAAGVTSDRIQRLNPKTGETIEYLLPRYTDARRLSFDDSGKQLKVWIPNKNAASLIELEPLE